MPLLLKGLMLATGALKLSVEVLICLKTARYADIEEMSVDLDQALNQSFLV